MRSALQSDSREIDIHHAGTAMRFLTAYYALSKGKEVILTGSKRMQERPIAPLVEALRKAGADIEYVKKKAILRSKSQEEPFSLNISKSKQI